MKQHQKKSRISNFFVLLLFFNTSMPLWAQSTFSSVELTSFEQARESNNNYISYNQYPFLTQVITKLGKYAHSIERYHTLSEAFQACYNAIIQNTEVIELPVLLKALPEIIEFIALQKENLVEDTIKAPRLGQEIVAPGTCDLSEVIRLLKKIDRDVLTCCPAEEFVGTFTILNDIETTLTTCCATIQNNFNGTFTVIRSDFNQTFTVLNSINNTLTTCCAANAAGFNGTFTAINALNNLVISDFNQTFTVLNSINNTLTTCCAANAIGFNGTFTVLNALLATNTTSANTNALLRASLCNPTLITQASYNAMPTPKTLTSGAYLLAENITYNPVAPGTAALIISQPGILLDMGCFTLRQGNIILTTNGIQIAANANDAEIRNGTVMDFSGDAIQFNSTALERPYIHNVNILDAGVNGITFIGATPHSVLRGKLKNISIMHTGTSITNAFGTGFNLTNSDDFVINNIYISSSGNAATSFNGASLTTCNNTQINTITVNDNAVGGILSGINSSSSNAGDIKNINVMQNQGFNVFGILFSGQDNVFDSVNITNNYSQNFVIGMLNGTGSGNVIANVNCLSNTVTGGTGIYRGSQSNLTTNANTYNNYNSLMNVASGATAGFVVGGTNHIFDNCKVAGDTATSVGASPGAFGFIGITTGKDILIKNCVVQGISALGLASIATQAYGYFFGAGYTDVSCMECRAADLVSTSTSIGFIFDNSTNPQMTDCTSTSNTIGYSITGAVTPKALRNIAMNNNQSYRGFAVGSTQNAVDMSQINTVLTNPWTNVVLG